MATNGQHDVMAENDYDPTEAKFCACLFWLIFHATEDGEFGDIPSEITCPTERDPEERFLVRSNVVNFLCKGTIYVKVCSQVFQSEDIKSTWDVIQKLSKEGLYVIDTNDEAVTEERLLQNDEFDLDAHLAMMDTLMMANVNKSVEIQQIVSAISSFASFNAAKELPFDLEDAMLLWLNKVSATNEKRLRKSRSPEAISAGSSGRFRFKREQIVARSATLFPKLDDLQMDVANGKALLSLLLFYFPEALSHENIKTSDPMNQSDVICNIELFRELCAQHVCTSVFALRTEDFIYRAPELKNNLLALLTEIFVIVELEKSALDIVDNRGNIEGDKYVRDVELDNRARVLDKYCNEVETSTKENFNPNGLSGNLRTPRTDENQSEENESFRGGLSPSSYERLKNFELFGSEEKQQMIDDADDVEQSIQDQLQKLKTLSSMKKGFIGKEAVPSDSERSYFGIEKEQWNPDSPSKADLLHKTSSVVKSRQPQPLLSKRSKKQLKNLGNEERSFSQEDLSGVHLVDFDLKRSHSLTSVIGKSNYSVDPSNSFKAWGEEKCNEELAKSKGQKISLDFKPDVTNFRRQTPISSTEQLEPNPVRPKLAHQQSSDSSLARWQTQNDFAGKRYGQSCGPDDTPKRLLKPFYDQSNTTFGSHENNSSGDLQNFRTEILERTRKVDSRKEQASDFEEPQFEDDDLFTSGQFVSNTPSKSKSSVLGHGQSPRPNKMLGLDTKQNLVQQHTFGYEHVKDHDDDLSTIAETSEPSTPTVYSFRTDRSEDGSENSRTLGTDDGTRESCDDCQSPTVVSQDITPFNSMDEVELHKTIPDSANEFQCALKNKQSAGSEDDSLQENGPDGHLLKRPSITTGISYTVVSSDMSLEAAKAAGLPIIGSGSAYNDIDVNSFDSEVLDVKVEGPLKSEREMNPPEIGQGNEQFVVTDLGEDGTSFRMAEDPALGHFNSASDSDNSVNDGKVCDFQEANNHPVFQEDLVSSYSLKGDASSRNVAMDFSNRKHMQGRSQKNRHCDLQQLGQSDEIDEEALHSQRLKSENKTAGGVIDTLDDITRSFQPPSGIRNPLDLEVKGEGPHLVAGKESSIEAFREEEPFDINCISAIDDRDANSTITWSDIKAEKKSSRRNLKSPEKEKGRAVTNVGDCPVINWAESAKNREPVDDAYESEGRVFVNLISYGFQCSKLTVVHSSKKSEIRQKNE